MNSTPTDQFIPLGAAAPRPGQRTDLTVKVLTHADGAKAFQPLAAPPNTGANHTQNCKPRVSVQREGERVSVITVHCNCGQVIELACQYA